MSRGSGRTAIHDVGFGESFESRGPEVGKPLKRSSIEHWEVGSVLTITEVADILRVHPTTIYRLVKRGELPGFKIGGCWRINRDSLDKWLSGGISGHP